MKILSFISIACGLLALSIGIYHIVETEPNREYYSESHMKIMSKFGFSDNLTARQKGLRDSYKQLWESAEAASDMQGISIAILSILGLITGAIAFFKGKQKLGLPGIILSVGCAIIPLITKTHMFS